MPKDKIAFLLCLFLFCGCFPSFKPHNEECKHIDVEDGKFVLIHEFGNLDQDFPSSVYFVNNDDEMVTLCHAAWGMKPAAAHQEVFYEWLRDSIQKLGDVDLFLKRLMNEVLGDSHFLDDKVDYIENVVKPLIAAGFLDKDDLSKALTEALFEKSTNGENTVMMAGVLPECLYAIDGDLNLLYDKAKREKESFEINLKRIVAKDKDGVFSAGKRCIELRLVLKWLVVRYAKKPCAVIDKVKTLLDEIDNILDAYGLGETKKMYESYVIKN